MARQLEPGPVELSAVALALADQLVLIARDGAVAALDPGGRRLWEALEAGWSVADLVEASVQEGRLPREVATRSIAGALASWRALSLVGPRLDRHRRRRSRRPSWRPGASAPRRSTRSTSRATDRCGCAAMIPCSPE